MNNYSNYVQLVGHLGLDPEVININPETTVTKFSLATNQSYKDKNGEFQTKTHWHTLVAWGKLGLQMADNLSKGSQILINGSLEQRTWEAADGSKRKSTEIKIKSYLHVNRPRNTHQNEDQVAELAQ